MGLMCCNSAASRIGTDANDGNENQGTSNQQYVDYATSPSSGLEIKLYWNIVS